MITPLLQAAKKAAKKFNQATNQQRQDLVRAIGTAIKNNKEIILTANKKDLNKMEKDNPLFDRLLLTAERLDSIASACMSVADLADPTNKILTEHSPQEGLNIQKVSVPIGVVGAIFEARPNVTIDICVLSLRSGNAAVLKGGSDAYESNNAIISIIHEVLAAQNFPTETIQLLPAGREYVADFLAAKEYIDILIPRGSKRLINFVRENAKIPTIETGAGVCHTYVHADADTKTAARIIENAKISRPSVCNCLDTIVIHVDKSEILLAEIIAEFKTKEVGVWADERAFKILSTHNYPFLHKAEAEDFGREFLSLNCSIKVVDNYEEAVTHINKHSSTHSEAIVTKDLSLAEKFLNEVDAACVFVNSSTRFADGEVFGLGAEIGISTQKLHARGPFALEKLVTEKWLVRGNGQVR
jgi:glutamate-5-semialdehyde dehydrogenase